MNSDLVDRARAVEGVARNGSLISDMADEIERLEAELFAANLSSKTFEEGYDEATAARRYLEQKIKRLEAEVSKLRAVKSVAREIHDWQWDHKHTYHNIDSAVVDLGLIIARLSTALEKEAEEMNPKLRVAEVGEYFKGPTDFTEKELKQGEKAVEKKSCDVAKANGWFRRKLSSPGDRGVMDRIFIKEGRAVFIEYKRVGEIPTPLQRQVAAEMLDHGAEVWWTDTVRGTKMILRILT